MSALKAKVDALHSCCFFFRCWPVRADINNVWHGSMIHCKLQSGRWFQPSWKTLVNGKDYPIYYEKYKKHVWNHQPDMLCSSLNSKHSKTTLIFQSHARLKVLFPCSYPKFHGTMLVYPVYPGYTECLTFHDFCGHIKQLAVGLTSCLISPCP